jgi:hypothetical protein
MIVFYLKTGDSNLGPSRIAAGRDTGLRYTPNFFIEIF